MIGDIFSSLCLYWFRTSDRPPGSKLCFGLVFRDPTAPVEGLQGRELQVSTRRPLLSLSNLVDSATVRSTQIKTSGAKPRTHGTEHAKRPLDERRRCAFSTAQQPSSAAHIGVTGNPNPFSKQLRRQDAH